jgi:site-specific recombinase XerC
MPRRVFPARHAVNPLVRFGQLLTDRQPGAHEELVGRCAELWLVWKTKHTATDLTRRQSSLSALVEVWTSELSESALDPVSIDGIQEYVRQLLGRGLAKTTVWMNLNYLRMTLDDLGLASPESRAALRQIISSEAVKGAPLSSGTFRYQTLRKSEITKIVVSADAGDPLDISAVAMMLLMYECMADISEVLGRPANVAGAQAGVMLSDLELAGAQVRLTFPAPFEGWMPRRCTLSLGASAWLRLWLEVRGNQPGLVFMRRANYRPETDRRFIIQTLAGWNALKRPGGVLERAGIDPKRVSAMSLKTGRALGLFEAGYDLSHIASKSSWQTSASLVAALCKALEGRQGKRVKRESSALDWPLPSLVGEGSIPVQIMLL